MSPTTKAARTRIARYAALAATTLACAALAACSTATPPPSPSPSPRPADPRPISMPQAPTTPVPVVSHVRNAADMAAASLPIEQYLLTPAQNSGITHAMWLLAGQCMRAHGQPFAVPPQATSQRTGSELSRRYGPTDLAQARRYGYHSPPNPIAAAAEPPSIADLPPAERQALTGSPNSASIPVGGCRGQAMRVLEGGQSESAQSSQSSQSIAQQIDLQSYQSSLHSAQVAAVEAQWSACMAAHGHHYRTPGDAFNDPAWRSAPSPSHAEIATALDDIQCKWQTNLIGVWASVEMRIQQDAITQYQADLNLERSQEIQELATAARVAHAA